MELRALGTWHPKQESLRYGFLYGGPMVSGSALHIISTMVAIVSIIALNIPDSLNKITLNPKP